MDECEFFTAVSFPTELNLKYIYRRVDHILVCQKRIYFRLFRINSDLGYHMSYLVLNSLLLEYVEYAGKCSMLNLCLTPDFSFSFNFT